MKAGWGTRVALLYTGFAVLIISLVVGSMRQRIDLVSPDYYADELRYQEIIDAARNQSSLSEPVAVTQTAGGVLLRFPEEFRDQPLNGTVRFYAPSDKRADQEFPVTVSENRMLVPADALAAADYMVKIHWEANHKSYYQETRLNLYGSR